MLKYDDYPLPPPPLPNLKTTQNFEPPKNAKIVNFKPKISFSPPRHFQRSPLLTPSSRFTSLRNTYHYSLNIAKLCTVLCLATK